MKPIAPPFSTMARSPFTASSVSFSPFCSVAEPPLPSAFALTRAARAVTTGMFIVLVGVASGVSTATAPGSDRWL